MSVNMIDEFKDQLNRAIAHRVLQTGRHLTAADKRDLLGQALRKHWSECPSHKGGICECGASEFA